MWTSKEEQLKLLRNVEYHAPSGFFDDASEGRPEPCPLLETEDDGLRMEVFRQVLARLVLQHVVLCIFAIAGVQVHNMKLMLPAYAAPAAAASAFVIYILMWCYATRASMNGYLMAAFTLMLGAYLAVSVAGEGPHIVANVMFQCALGWVLMLLYSMPSFCCNLSIFDIKYTAGVIGYTVCLMVAALVGWAAAVKIGGGTEHIMHSSIPVVAGVIYMLGALWSVRTALGYFYKEFGVAIAIFPWAYPIDFLFRVAQFASRTYIYPLQY